MKKSLSVLSLTLLLLLALAAPAHAQGGKFWLSAIGDNAEAITNCRVYVLTAGTLTLPTIYTTASLATAASNPLTCDSASGVAEWFSTTATTAFDAIIAVDSGAYKGAYTRVDNVRRDGQHTVRMSRPSPMKRLYIPGPTSASATVTTDTRTLPAGATHWLQAGLSPNRLYEVLVRAVNAGGESASAPASRYTAAAAPAGLAIVAVGSSAASLAWTPGGNPAGTIYELQRSTGGAFMTAWSGSGDTFTDAGLAAGAFYLFALGAIAMTNVGRNAAEASS
jgi:hypothetical protein